MTICILCILLIKINISKPSSTNIKMQHNSKTFIKSINMKSQNLIYDFGKFFIAFLRLKKNKNSTAKDITEKPPKSDTPIRWILS